MNNNAISIANYFIDKSNSDPNSKYPLTLLRKEELRRIELENEALEGENQGDAQDREQRKDFADRIFSFVCNYMIFVCILLFLKAITPRFYLSDNVIITLLGTTTANVIGILIIVVTYLFSRKRK